MAPPWACRRRSFPEFRHIPVAALQAVYITNTIGGRDTVATGFVLRCIKMRLRCVEGQRLRCNSVAECAVNSNSIRDEAVSVRTVWNAHDGVPRVRAREAVFEGRSRRCL
jgi:hypothetical protein